MWLTQWRPNLMDAYVNYEYLRHEMWPAYQKADLPEALLFGIMAKESGGKVHAVSRSGAAGPLQFMYATGLRFGLGTVNGFDTRFDPAEAARANADYLNEQLKAFNDNLELTLGAYNGGEGRMRRLVNGDAAVSFYDPRIYDQLSQETRDYVPSVLAAAWLFLHPDSYNLRFPKIDGAPGSITLKRAASLSELTVCLGEAGGMQDGWFRTLRNLNPRLNPQQEQPVGAVLQVPKPLVAAYASRCVDGPWPILASDLHDAVVPVVPVRHDPPSRTRRYTVRRGDTISGISRRYDCSSAREIERRNGIRHHQIRVGQVLTLPGCKR
jgi:membrane-bound lytic murein transglycosylase D